MRNPSALCVLILHLLLTPLGLTAAETQIIARSTIVRGDPINKGGTSIIYEGTLEDFDAHNGLINRIDIVVKKYLNIPEQILYDQEVAAIKVLPDHPNIITYYDMNDRFKEITMERMDGDLFHLEKNHPTIFADQFIPILRQILSGMDAIHKAGVIHGDIKFENIFYRKKYADDKWEVEIKIGDFGTSQIGNVEPLCDVLMGSHYLLPPEYCAANPWGLTTQLDLWPLGLQIARALGAPLLFDEFHKKYALPMDTAPIYDSLSGLGREIVIALTKLNPTKRKSAEAILELLKDAETIDDLKSDDYECDSYYGSEDEDDKPIQKLVNRMIRNANQLEADNLAMQPALESNDELIDRMEAMQKIETVQKIEKTKQKRKSKREKCIIM